jgi:hypothetical protein
MRLRYLPILAALPLVLSGCVVSAGEPSDPVTVTVTAPAPSGGTASSPAPAGTSDTLTTITPGDWIVGEQVAPGRWRTTEPVDPEGFLCDVTQENAAGEELAFWIGQGGPMIIDVLPRPGSILRLDDDCPPFELLNG